MKLHLFTIVELFCIPISIERHFWELLLNMTYLQRFWIFQKKPFRNDEFIFEKVNGIFTVDVLL